MNEWYLSSLFQGGTCSRTVNKCLANKQSYKYIFFLKCRMFANYRGRKEFYIHLHLTKNVEGNI